MNPWKNLEYLAFASRLKLSDIQIAADALEDSGDDFADFLRWTVEKEIMPYVNYKNHFCWSNENMTLSYHDSITPLHINTSGNSCHTINYSLFEKISQHTETKTAYHYSVGFDNIQMAYQSFRSHKDLFYQSNKVDFSDNFRYLYNSYLYLHRNLENALASRKLTSQGFKNNAITKKTVERYLFHLTHYLMIIFKDEEKSKRILNGSDLAFHNLNKSKETRNLMPLLKRFSEYELDIEVAKEVKLARELIRKLHESF